MNEAGLRSESVLRVADIAILLSGAERAVTQRLEAALDVVSVEQWRAMSLLGDGRGHSMSELSEFAMLPPPSLTRLVDQMVSESLAYRRPDPLDRRRVLVFLAKRGVRLYRRLAERVAMLDTAISDADVERLRGLLESVLEDALAANR